MGWDRRVLPSGSGILGSVCWTDLACVALVVVAIYFLRLSTLPICGEEPRWACGAIQMMETGDWIVPRQQGQVFPERPPLSSWAMAAVAYIRGEMDAVSIRLPSVLAILVNAIAIVVYSGRFLSRIGAFSAGLMYATMGQVMQIGRMGESESLFTLFLSGALMAWHACYSAGGARWRMWAVGYALVACAALVKGIQAPIYFAVAAGSYLLVQRQWRELLRWEHLAGLSLFAAIVGAWQIPFFFATDWPSVKAIWWGLAGDRLTWNGLLVHLVSYPLETFGCLLPWSTLLFLLVLPEVRRSLAGHRPLTLFIMLAVGLTYPSVWFASMARGRYFMPLYPLIAVLLAAILECCVQSAADSRVRRWWNRSVSASALVAFVAAIVVLAAGLVPLGPLLKIAQPAGFAIVFSILAAAIGAFLWSHGRGARENRARYVLLTFCALVGLIQTGVVINVNSRIWNDPRRAMAEAQSKLPSPESLVSFGPADHRFVYFYGKTIPELPWPTSRDQFPSDIEYFCFDRHIVDTPETRINGRGRSWGNTPGTLPIQWEEIAVVNCERRIRPNPFVVTVIARVTDPELRTARRK